MPAPAISRDPSERLLEQRKKVSKVGLVPVPPPISATTAEMIQEMVERQKRIHARTEQVKKQQKEDLDSRREVPIMPLTELEKQQIQEKKQGFVEKTETFELTNRAINVLKQTLVELQIQPRGNVQKLSGNVIHQNIH